MQNFEVSAPPPDTVLWRYMDLSKFLSMLEGENIIFSRADNFIDMHEGYWPKATLLELEKLKDENGTAERIANQPMLERARMFVSCWHENPYESAAMWIMYLTSKEGVAIKTTAGALEKQLQNSGLHVEFGKVQYIDYDADYVDHGRVFYPYYHKSYSYQHEREVRAVVWNNPSPEHPIKVVEDSRVFPMPVRLSELIHAVVVSPGSAPWFLPLVEKVLKRYGLSVEVAASKVNKGPEAV